MHWESRKNLPENLSRTFLLARSHGRLCPVLCAIDHVVAAGCARNLAV